MMIQGLQDICIARFSDTISPQLNKALKHESNRYKLAIRTK